MLSRITSAISLGGLVLVLAACSSGGGSSSSGSTAAFVPPADGGDWETRGVTFDPVQAQQLLASGEFRYANADCSYAACDSSSGLPAVNQSQAFELHEVHFAHSAGLSGAGQLVAVVDNGFRLSHQEFTGKTIYQSGNLPLASHGTHVASLIAAKKDGRGMHGVAPGASLHLTAINPSAVGGTLDMANVTAGTRDAAQRGAVAQNNSWGFEVAADSIRSYLDANPGASTAQALAARIGYGTGGWQGYLDALDEFQQGGVVVWALSNDEAMLSGDAMATLPHFETRLGEAWIAAANGYFEVDGSGAITNAVRLSAACGLAASFCIAGDGTTTAASAAGDASYGSGTGTSYVAPQVAASVALLAEAFPDLTPAEWTKRLLASADNSWFAALGVPTDGTVAFGNGISHDYSAEWGHGVLDLKAALSPIGSVSVLSGESVTTSARMTLDESAIVLAPGFGDGLSRALQGQEMAVFDALNRSFALDAGSFVQPQGESLSPSPLDQVQARRSPSATLQVPELGPQVHFTRQLGNAVNSSGAPQGNASAQSLAGEAITLSSTSAVGPFAVTAYGFAGGHQRSVGGSVGGGGVSIAVPAGNGFVSFGVGSMAEQGAVLGMASSNAFDFGGGSSISTFNVGLDQQLAPTVRAFGRLEYGAAEPRGRSPDSFVTATSDIRFAGMQLGAVKSGVVTNDDSLTFTLGQPLRVESGTVDLSIPVGRTAEGTVVNSNLQAELAPSGRQLDLGLAYALKLPNEASAQIGLQYAVDAGHVRGASSFGIAASLGQSF